MLNKKFTRLIKRVHAFSGGGGGPSSSTQSATNIPAYARPYVERLLGKAEAITDLGQNPYQAYEGQRQAQFTPMQQQAFQGAGAMQPSKQGALGADIAAQAGLGALGTQYNPYQTGQFTAGTARQYMSPYMQNVVDVEKREAARRSSQQALQNQAQATTQGAFGGARSAIVEAERLRNLGQQMGDIQSRGLQSAYDQAANRFQQEQQLREQSRQYGAGLGMQGLQTALQSAGTLGQLGGQQFQQGMDINKLQAQYGGLQQQREQNILNQQYQDFLTQKQYPYQQLGFMSDLIRGLPLSGSGMQSVYQAPPSMAQSLGSLGLSAYGLSKLAEGGEVNLAAGGGVGANSAGFFGDGGSPNDPTPSSSFGLGGIALNKLVGGQG